MPPPPAPASFRFALALARTVPRLALGSVLLLGAALRAAPATGPGPRQLFLLIGQSNMAGRGALRPADQVPHPRIFMLRPDLAWVPAVDPLHADKPALAGVGLASNFARVLAAVEPDTEIGLIPAAFGGTSLDEWAVGQPLFTTAVARARAAQKAGTLAGILWHQGEADSAPDRAATYAPRFAAMIAELRRQLGAEDVPVLVGETGRFRPNGAAINAVLAQLPARVPHCAFVSAEGLGDKGDQLHFDSASLDEFGRRYAQAWFALAGRDPRASLAPPGAKAPGRPPAP